MAMRRPRFLLILALLILSSAIASSDDRRCSLCGNAIAAGEKYFQVKDGKEIFCEHCYLEAPRCNWCKLPTARESLDPDTGICTECLAKLPRCKACGKPITGVFYQFSSSKGVFCADCKKNRPGCAICGAPIGATYWEYPDGRNLCNDCGARAIFDAAAIEGIVKDVRQTMEKQLSLRLKYPIRVIVQKLSGISSSELNHKDKVTTADVALYGKELGLYRFENGRSEIYLLYGLPPDLLYEAAAHECAHAWEAENGLINLEPELREGFAQWVAAEVLKERGFRDTWERLDARRDFPYGTGYQRLKSMHQKIVLELMRKKH